MLDVKIGFAILITYFSGHKCKEELILSKIYRMFIFIIHNFLIFLLGVFKMFETLKYKFERIHRRNARLKWQFTLPI